MNYYTSIGYTQDAVVFSYYSDNTMNIYNVTSDNSAFSEVIPAKIKDFEEDTALSRRGNDIMQNVEKVTIAKDVTGIGSYYFYQCSGLKEVHIGPDVSYIGTNAFKDCVNLDTITIDPANQYFEIKYGCLVEISTGLVIRGLGDSNITLGSDINALSESAFYGCSNLESIDMSQSAITVIPQKAFRECTNLSTVKFPENLVEIGYSSFFKCSNLKGVDFKGLENLSKIGNYAFYRCNSIETIEFPASLVNIEAMAFANCEGLTKIVTDTTNIRIGYSVFYECANVKEVYVNCPEIMASSENSARNGYLIAVSFYGAEGFVERDITLYVNSAIDESTFGEYFKENEVYNDRNELIRVEPVPYVKDAEVTVDGVSYIKYNKNVK